jgi:hypothetical protein
MAKRLGKQFFIYLIILSFLLIVFQFFRFHLFDFANIYYLPATILQTSEYPQQDYTTPPPILVLNTQPETKPIKQYETSKYRAAVFETNTWIFNDEVMQYSTYAQNNSNSSIQIRSIVALSTDKPKKLACIISEDDKNFFVYPLAKLMVLNNAFHIIYLVECVFLEKDFSNASNIYVAIVEAKNYQTNSGVGETLLFAQRPRFYLDKKQSGVTNCVHTLRDVNSARYKDLLNWLEMNIALGFSSMTFYHIDEDKKVLWQILGHHPNFVEVVDYNLNIESICSRLEQHGLKACKEKYEFLFKSHYFNFHERLCTNDCNLFFFGLF